MIEIKSIYITTFQPQQGFHFIMDFSYYLEWNDDRFRKWAERIGINTYTAVNAILTSKGVEQQSCMVLQKLAEKYSDAMVEAACKMALSYTASPSEYSCAVKPPVRADGNR